MDKFFDFLEAGRHVDHRAGYLISGFLLQQLNGEEREELDAWILASDGNMKLFDKLTSDEMMETYVKWYAEREVETRLAAVKLRLAPRPGRLKRLLVRYIAAACVAGIIGVCISLMWPAAPERLSPVISPVLQDIQPGGEKAFLRMDDGRVVYLTSMDTMISDALMIRGGELVYDSDDLTSVAYHEIVIPRKGSYKVVLPDGTKVWLNAESSIRYPTSFTGLERRVTVTGETFFQVHKDPSRPFVVTVGDLSVEALGTAFNINAYPNERSVQTTLKEGAVRVSGGTRQSILRPGQQLAASGPDWKLDRQADMRSVLSWIDNQLRWKDAGIDEIMRQIERWYDAKVIYKDRINYHFNGTFDRTVPVSKILNLLEETGHVHFTIEGNTITVRK